MTSGQDTWSARCVETRTAGAAGGPGKPTGSDPGRAPRSDPTGRFYKSRLIRFLEQQINPFLVKWARRKFKRYRRASRKARQKLADIASVYPGMFAHWRHGALPTGSTTGAV
jgi:hypothetical protein